MSDSKVGLLSKGNMPELLNADITASSTDFYTAIKSHMYTTTPIL